jgi:hypothetical protein
MSKQYRVSQKIGNVAITANGFQSIDLPRDSDYEAIGLRIVASLQVTALATSVRAEAPSQLVPRIQIVADGKNVLFNAPFWATGLGNFLRSGKDEGARAITPPSGVAVAAYAVEACGVIDFCTPDGVRPKDSNFRSVGLSLFQAVFNFGAAGDAFVGGTVAFSGSPIIEVYALKCVEGVGADGKVTTPIALKKVSYQEIALAATNPALEVRLPAGNLVRSVFVRTEGSVTAGEPSTAILNNLQLQNGLDTRVNLSAGAVRAINNMQFGKITSGYYVHDFMRQGQGGNNMLANLWDVTGPAEPKAILDVTGGANNKAQLVITEYILAQAA